MALLSDIEHVEPVLARTHGLLEAPRFGANGALIYSDVIGGGVWSCSSDGEVSELLSKRRGIGGIVAHADGGWVISGRSVIRLGADGDQREILGEDGVCGYNDLGSARDGTLLAGALCFRPFAGEAPCPGRLVSIDRDGNVETLCEEVLWPNGIGTSSDGETVYISDYARSAVLAVPRGGGAAEEFCRSPRGSADGLALDRDGGVWVALGEGAAIARFHADGTLDDVVAVPARFVSSLCFGGADGCDVLITTADNEVHPETGGALLRARSEVAGLPLAPVAA